MRALMIAAALAFATAAAAQSGSSGMSADEFVAQAASGDMYEIQSSKMALEKGGPKVKEFAQKIITDHTRSAKELEALTKKAKLKISKAMSPAHQKMLAKLDSLEGEAFDQAYLEDQIHAHKQAVSLFDRYARMSKHPVLGEWAAKTLESLKMHLKMAETLEES